MKIFSRLNSFILLIASGLVFSTSGYSEHTDTTVDQMNQESIHDNTVTNHTMISDETIFRDIQSKLPSDLKDVNVRIVDGIVFLTGQVNSDTDYESVVTLVQSTQGVKDVKAENLLVKGSQDALGDLLITAKVKGAILREDILGKDIPSWSVHVETKNGTVYLSGTVDTPTEKQNVMNAVKTVKGITTIDDQMTIAADMGAATSNAQ